MRPDGWRLNVHCSGFHPDKLVVLDEVGRGENHLRYLCGDCVLAEFDRIKKEEAKKKRSEAARRGAAARKKGITHMINDLMTIDELKKALDPGQEIVILERNKQNQRVYAIALDGHTLLRIYNVPTHALPNTDSGPSFLTDLRMP